MKKFLLTVAVLSICLNATLAYAGPKGSGGGSKPSGSGPKPIGTGKNSSTGKPNFKQGKSSNQKRHAGNWRGWSSRQYSNGLGCWIYWSTDDNCWYRYDDESQTYVPCNP